MVNTGAGGPNWERPLSKPGAADPIHAQGHDNLTRDSALYVVGAALYYAASAQGKDLSTKGKKAKWFIRTTLEIIGITLLAVVGGFAVIAGFWLGFLWLLENA